MTTTPPAGHPAPLPEGWSIRLAPTSMNLTVLTLQDADGASREIGFQPGPSAAETRAERTVRSLEDIDDFALRDAVGRLVECHTDRCARAQANADVFAARFPDLPGLTARLRAAVPDSSADLRIDTDTLAVVLVLAAPATGSGHLLMLVNRWWPAEPETPHATPDGMRMHFDPDTRTLTVHLDQEPASCFLAWLSRRPEPGPPAVMQRTRHARRVPLETPAPAPAPTPADRWTTRPSM